MGIEAIGGAAPCTSCSQPTNITKEKLRLAPAPSGGEGDQITLSAVALAKANVALRPAVGLIQAAAEAGKELVGSQLDRTA